MDIIIDPQVIKLEEELQRLHGEISSTNEEFHAPKLSDKEIKAHDKLILKLESEISKVEESLELAVSQSIDREKKAEFKISQDRDLVKEAKYEKHLVEVDARVKLNRQVLDKKKIAEKE